MGELRDTSVQSEPSLSTVEREQSLGSGRGSRRQVFMSEMVGRQNPVVGAAFTSLRISDEVQRDCAVPLDNPEERMSSSR